MGRDSDLSFCGPVSGFRSFQLAPSPNSLSLSADLKGLCLQVSVVKSTCFWLGNLLPATWPLTTAQPGFCSQSALSWLFCFAPTPLPSAPNRRLVWLAHLFSEPSFLHTSQSLISISSFSSTTLPTEPSALSMKKPFGGKHRKLKTLSAVRKNPFFFPPWISANGLLQLLLSGWIC